MILAVVAQAYAVNVMEEYVLRGNSAILKCHIPSFVSDFVYVSSWIADEETEIFSTSDSYGTKESFLKIAYFCAKLPIKSLFQLFHSYNLRLTR